MKRLLFDVVSGLAGVIMIALDVSFAIWGGIGKAWYVYPLNLIILLLVSGVFNTVYIQGLTRGVSYICLHGGRGIMRALAINIPTVIVAFLACLITRLVFSLKVQTILFFGACITVSSIVAIVDNEFKVAVERTRFIESMTDK